MKTAIFTLIGRLMVKSLVFGMCGLGLVNGQPHKLTSLGLVCQSAKDCDGVGCDDGKVQPSYTWPMVNCQNCIGISNDALWRNPCPQCGRSRKVRSSNFTPPKPKTCQKCQGVGMLSFGPRFQVADADLPDQMMWFSAGNACLSLGDGWRLPTAGELRGMYGFLHRKGKGNFQGYLYWSSSEYDEHHAWYFNFETGEFNYGLPKALTKHVRAVRTLP